MLCFSQSIPEKYKDVSINGRVTDAYKQTSLDLTTSQYFICGNPLMVADMLSQLEQQGISKENIFHEKFTIHCITRQNHKSWIFLQDFSREKWILDKNKCPIWKTQPLSLFRYFYGRKRTLSQKCSKNKWFRTSL